MLRRMIPHLNSRSGRVALTLARFFPGRRPQISASEKIRSVLLAESELNPRQLSDRVRRFLPRSRKSVARSYGERGNMQVRLAISSNEVRASQALRYRVFYREMSAKADARALVTRRDHDQFDRLCDHMLVIDHGAKRRGVPLLRGSFSRVVASYRLLPQLVAESCGGFYTQGEYDLESLIKRHPGKTFLELGRSCVLKSYRTKSTIELLWHGVFRYIQENNFDVMVGCASLEGTNPDQLALGLSFLHHHARAPDEWMVHAHPHRYVNMNRMAKEDINVKDGLKILPPLIKGYLRLGAFIGDGAVVDHQFGTTDVIVILPTEQIKTRYVTHFGAPDDGVEK